MSLTKILKDLKQWKKICSILVFCETYHHNRLYAFNQANKKIQRIKKLKNGRYIKCKLTTTEKLDSWHYVGQPYKYTTKKPKQKKLVLYRGCAKD